MNRGNEYNQKKIMANQQQITINLDDDRKWVIREYLDSDNDEGLEFLY